jgi:TMEM175 potassium channel family protein
MLPRMADERGAADRAGAGATGAEVVEGDEMAPPAADIRGWRRQVDTGRVLALSDGVFAIAATLLVLDLRLPEDLPGEEVSARLHDLLPAAGAYALSYVLIGVLWLAHHRLFRVVGPITNRVAMLNLVLLGLVSLLPFVTSTLARYGDQALPVQLYAGTITAIFLVEVAVTVAAGHAGGLADQHGAVRMASGAMTSAAVFGVSIAIAAIPRDWAPDAAKYFWLATIPGRRLTTLAVRRRTRQVTSGARSGTA